MRSRIIGVWLTVASVADSLAVVHRSDPVWEFNGVNCTSFPTASGLGVELCDEFWATGIDEHGDTVTAYVACEISCGSGGAARECVYPALPEPEPELEPEPEPEPELSICAE